MTVTVTFVGTGDAFGTGGRFNSCYLVDAPGIRFVLDFGETSLVALNKLGIEHKTIDAVLLSHLHGDHSAGVSGMLIDGMFGAKREKPLTIAGPRDTKALLRAQMDASFPGSHVMEPKFEVTYLELPVLRPQTVAGHLTVTTYPAVHTAGTNPTSVRVEVAGKTIAYTGDSAWNKHLPALADGADLLIAECYFHEKSVPFHLNYPDIVEHRDELKAKRLVLTHFSREMLAAADQVPEECAYDGLVVEV